MKFAYIVIQNEFHGNGTSVCGIFHKRENAEKMIAENIAPYIKNNGYEVMYPDPNDKEGFVWLKKDGIMKYSWIIQTEFFKDDEI